jgi:hypothetical protein
MDSVAASQEGITPGHSQRLPVCTRDVFEGFVTRENDLLIADIIILDGTEVGGGTVLVDGMYFCIVRVKAVHICEIF